MDDKASTRWWETYQNWRAQKLGLTRINRKRGYRVHQGPKEMARRVRQRERLEAKQMGPMIVAIDPARGEDIGVAVLAQRAANGITRVLGVKEVRNGN